MLDALLAEARARWGLDAAAGLQLIAAERLDGIPVDAWRPLLVVPASALRSDPAAVVESLAGRHRAGDHGPLAVLRRLYPADHAVGRFGRPDGMTVGALDRDDLAAPVHVGPIAREDAVAGPWAMPWIADRLRRPDGCPWDREQTHRSLRKHLLEEAYEVYDALDTDLASPELAGELGDLLLQVVLHAQLAAESGAFDLADVEAAIATKIVRRHPHVFGDAQAKDADEVKASWAKIKAAEKKDRGALEGVPRRLPALHRAKRVSEKASGVGFDWDRPEAVLEKVVEEVGELRDALAAGDKAHVADELGDALFALVNLARHLDIDPEGALHATTEKFLARFSHVERELKLRGLSPSDVPLAELDSLWNQAKSRGAWNPPPWKGDGQSLTAQPPGGQRC